jgi:hypothetical protein
MAMKRGIIVLLMALSSTLVAQKMKYSELVLTFNGMTDEEMRNELKAYLMDDKEEPNVYFRLAIIYDKAYKVADPLTDYKLAQANANEAYSRFLQATQFVDAKEISKNNEYYYPYFPNSFDTKGKPAVEFSKVQTRIKNGMDSANLYRQKIPAIYSSFTRSVNAYDKAVKQFASISNQYESLEDLYLLFDDALNTKLGQLKTDYDSSIYYFDQYLTLIKEYPIRYHKQTYAVKPIETYRLDGFITRLNFLGDKVEFWNYSAWVDAVRKSVTANITDLRTKLNETETRLQESITKIKAGPIPDFKPQPLSKQLVLELNNVDKESAVLSLLHYQHYIQQWLYDTRNYKLDTANAERNAVAYSDFIHRNRHADTLIHELSTRITDLKIAMHKDFIAKYFGGKSAFEKYATDETAMIAKSFQDLAANLRTTILQPLDSNLYKNKEMLVRHTNKIIPLRIRPVVQEDLDKGLLFTVFNRKNPDGSAYLAGIHKPDKKVNNNVVFVAKVNPDGKVAWFQPFNPKVDTTSATADAHQSLGPAIVTPEGIAFLVRSEHMTNGTKLNTFFYLNDTKGDSKVKFTLVDNTYPRFIKYLEKLNAFVFVLKGAESKPNVAAKEDVTLMCVNVLKDILWKKTFALTGMVNDITLLTDGLLVSGNFMTINDSKGNEVRTKVNAQESNPFILRVSERGELTPMPISVPTSFYMTRCIHVGDNSINLIGTKDNFETGASKIFSPADPMHIMTTKWGQVIYTNY